MGFLKVLWEYIEISAPFLMLGLFAAGLIHEFLPFDKVKKWFGSKSLSGVVKASIMGVPLPLCSCAVIPAAVSLKKSGASNGSTSSFLISTPETGVDSISVTYAMMDLPMTIVRPIAAFLTAFVAGVMQLFFNEPEDEPQVEEEKKSSCCHSKKNEAPAQKSFRERIISVVKFGYTDLLEDIAFWLLFGLVLGAAINYFVPMNFFEQVTGSGLRFLILLIGIPLYICASATTPIAASLVLKGVSPGTALLLLLVGPATNVSNIVILQKYIGKKGVIINIVSIGLVALGLSYLIDYLYTAFSWPTDFKVSHMHEHATPLYLQIISVFFCVLHAKAFYMKEIKPRLFKEKKACHG